MQSGAPRAAGLSTRQAAIIAGLTYLANPVGISEFFIWPRLVIDHDLNQTVHYIAAHPQLFGIAILCYLFSLVGDIVMAWALYALLRPAGMALALLASWLQLAYAAMASAGLFNLVAVRNLLVSPDYLAAFGATQLHAQVLLMLRGFHNDFDLSLIVFGLHLLVVAYLVMRSDHVPRLIALPLAVAGLGWIINFAGPYLWPNLNFDFATIMAAGELVFMAWLLVAGWRVRPDGEAEGASHLGSSIIKT